MSISFEIYTSYFGIPAFIYFINFSCFEIRLLFLVWKAQNQNIIQDTYSLRRKLMKFYVLFYISIFIGLFLVTKLYFIKPYIIFIVSCTWLPQICYNLMYNNRTSLPIITIIIMTSNKLFFPFYFRGYTSNFLHLSQDLYLILICVGIVFFEFIVLYLQNIYGGRFFLPKSYSEKPKYNYYFERKELHKQIKDVDKAECVICLSPLIYNESDSYQSTSGTNTRNNIFNNNIKANDMRKENVPFKIIRKRCQTAQSCCLSTLSCLNKYLFNFHNVIATKSKGEYMITPCKHVFHCECLTNWILHKSECPTCRTTIPSNQE